MAPNQLQDVYYNYLYTINPIAERIRKDVDATKDAYQSLWHGLSTEEQNKILEEAIISPEIVLKYSKYKKLDENESESGFSWFTRSQMDLCKHIDSVRENFSANECKTVTVKQVVEKDQQDNKLINKIKSNALFKSLMPAEDKNKIIKNERIKPKAPPPPPPQISNTVETIHEFRPNINNHDVIGIDDNHDNADIPMTGFDFLDNW